jgi:hypothetical protein
MDILKKLTHPERIAQLRKERRHILQLAPEKALDAIQESSHAVPLVHSFPEQDFYFLIHDIGPEDSLPLLAMASARQWQYILDLEVWDDDRIDLEAVTYWLGLLAKADLPRFIQWVLNEKLIFVEYYLFQNIEVRIREHDEDPSDFGDDFFTFDNVFFIRYIKKSVLSSDSLPVDEARETLLNTLLSGLAAIEHTTFQKILLESTAMISAEFESEAFHWRNARLEEKGFLPFDTAIGVYYPLAPGDVATTVHKDMGASTEMMPVPMVTMGLLENDHIFARALQQIDQHEMLMALELEFVSLCNRIIVADRKTIREKKALGEMVRKACGYIHIGMQVIHDDPDDTMSAPALNRMAAMLCNIPLSHLFRVGYGRAVALKHRTERWLKDSWFRSQGLPLVFWDEAWTGVLGGLLLTRPLYFDHYRTGVLYREFSDLDDLRITEDSLDQLIAFDQLFSQMRIDISSFSTEGLTYKNLLLTCWARAFLGLDEHHGDLAYGDFKIFFRHLFARKDEARADTRSRERQLHRIPSEMKSAMMDWLCHETGRERTALSRDAAPALEALFDELEDEYGCLALDGLDSRFVVHFRIRQETAPDGS